MYLVEVTYSDHVVTVPVTSWPFIKSEDVQKVVIQWGQYSSMFHAASIYWLYPEGHNYVVGCGSVKYDSNPIIEVVFPPDGIDYTRQLEFMPDLKHSQVKLGWWKHG